MEKEKQTSLSRNLSMVLSLFLIAGLSMTKGYAKDSYTFGIVPQQAASKLARTWGPILEHLEKISGVRLSFATAKNIPVFEENLAKGKYDFAYMNPHHYVVYHKHTGYEAFAKEKDKKIHGIIVVRKDSNVKSIYDLKDQVLAFPSPLAFAASLVPRSDFEKKKIHIIPRYVLSHDSVYRNVADKNFIAGGGVIRTFKASEKDVRDKLRVLYTTDGYTPHAFAAHPSVPEQVRKQVLAAMQDMEKTKEGKKLLQPLRIKGIEEAKDRDWDDVRGISY